MTLTRALGAVGIGVFDVEWGLEAGDRLAGLFDLFQNLLFLAIKKSSYALLELLPDLLRGEVLHDELFLLSVLDDEVLDDWG